MSINFLKLQLAFGITTQHINYEGSCIFPLQANEFRLVEWPYRPNRANSKTDPETPLYNK